MPRAEPICVAADSAPDEGLSGPSVDSGLQSGRLDRLGQSPVDDERFAILPEHDVARLQVAVQHAPAMGVGHRVADVEEATQELAEFHGPLARVRLLRRRVVIAIHRLFEAVAADEAHGVVGPAVAILAQAIDRYDPRMLQPAGDLGLQNEPGPAVGVVGMLVLDLLQGHVPLKLLVAGHGDLAQAAFGMRAENAEPRAGRRGTADRGGLLVGRR